MSENSKDYAQRPQQNFTFLNSTSVLTSYYVESYIYVEQGLKQTPSSEWIWKGSTVWVPLQYAF